MTSTRSTYDFDYLVQEDKVHGDVYTDTGIFREEMARIFHRWWVYVGHASEIPETGDYVVRWIGKQSVIMARDEDGRVRLMMNRCRHRANAVCSNDQGNASFFRCWYHGWTYSNTGELIGVPYPSGYDDSFRKEEYGLTQAPRLGEYRGFVFGSLAATGMAFDEYLGKAKDMIDLLVDHSPAGEIEVRAGVHKGSYNGNWKFVGMDGYHPAFTHATVADGMRKRTGQGFDDATTINQTRDMGNGHVRLDYTASAPVKVEQTIAALQKTEWGRKYLQDMERAHGIERTKLVLGTGSPHAGIWPNLQVIDIQIRVIRPTAPDRTEIFMYPTLLKGAPPELNAQRLRQHEWFYGSSAHGSPDDYEMFERNQMGLTAQVDPWMILTRGRAREWRADDGTLVGHKTDETTQRGQLREWKRVMSMGE